MVSICPECAAPLQASAIPGVGWARCPTCGETVVPAAGAAEPRPTLPLEPDAALRLAVRAYLNEPDPATRATMAHALDVAEARARAST